MGKGYKGRNPRGGKREADEQAEAEWRERQRGGGGQSSNVGELPPSGSEDEEEEAVGSRAKPAPPAPKGQPATAGLLPPSGSDSEDDGDSSSSASEPEYFKAVPKKKEPVVAAPDPEQVRKDMERLALIRQKREEDKLKRIAADGWDRFAPITETNKPPGHYVPPKHDDDDD